MSTSPVLVAESGVDENGVGLSIYCSTSDFLLYGFLDLITWHSQRALLPFIIEIWKCNITKHSISIAQEITLHLECFPLFVHSFIYLSTH